MKKATPLLLLVMLFILATNAFAANRAETFSLSPFIGGYSFDGKQHLETDPVYGLRAGYNFTDHFGAEAVFDFVASEFTSHGRQPEGKVNVFNYRLDALYHFFPENRLVPYLAAGYGGNSKDYPHGIEDTTKGALNIGAGLKYFLTDNMALRGDVRDILISDGRTKNEIEYTAGLSFFFGGAKPAPVVVAPAPAPAPVPVPVPVPVVKELDSDNDGVPDSLDKCPGTPAGVKVDKDGCPLDSDGDGVPDYLDKCPDTPKGVAVDKDGCPVDTDGDGVPDYLDKCPNTPKGVAVDKDGCPLDTDGDGVPDYLDKCPDTPKGVAVDKDGCPLDTDGDGVPDYLDKCPDTPKGTSVNKDGCPPPAEKLCILLDVEFDTNKSDIKAKYNNELKKVGDFLKEYPTATGVIEGHTDNVGGAAYNLKLSQKRAESVRKYIIDKFGISPARLSAKGYGLSKPVAVNTTEAGRQKNRRINATFDCVIKK